MVEPGRASGSCIVLGGLAASGLLAVADAIGAVLHAPVALDLGDLLALVLVTVGAALPVALAAAGVHAWARAAARAREAGGAIVVGAIEGLVVWLVALQSGSS